MIFFTGFFNFQLAIVFLPKKRSDELFEEKRIVRVKVIGNCGLSMFMATRSDRLGWNWSSGESGSRLVMFQPIFVVRFILN